MENNPPTTPGSNPVTNTVQPASKEGKPLLVVHMSSPEKIFFEGTAEAITSVNDRGEFDLLPLHENFICIIKKKAIIHYKIHGEQKEFELESGVIKIQKNKVYILTGFEVLGDKGLVPGSEELTTESIKPVTQNVVSAVSN